MYGFEIEDGNGGTDNAIVTVIVGGSNDNPVAVNDTATTNEENAVLILVLANDSDIDGDILSISNVTNPSNGSVAIVNNSTSITYTPNLNFSDVDTFIYTVSDGNGGTDTATVTITVNPQNDAPSFSSIPTGLNINEGDTFTYNITATDPDAGDTLGFTALIKPTWLTLTPDGNNAAILTSPSPTSNSEIGSHNVLLEVKDLAGEVSTQNFTINVNGKPQFDSTPELVAYVNVDYIYNINASDPDNAGNELTITALTKPDWLTLTDNGDGTAKLENILNRPNSSDVGTHSIELQVSDGNVTREQLFDLSVQFTPTINSFTASSTNINIEDEITLMWDVVGGTPMTLTIDQGVGDVTGLTQVVVTPTGAPTTYTLTAGNGGGAATEQVTITVNYPSGCTDPVDFVDSNLETAVLVALNTAGPITCYEMFKSTSLKPVSTQSIQRLDGLEHASELEVLIITAIGQQNFIKDLSILENMKKLYYLEIEANDITDITPLQNLPELSVIQLANNDISDISALQDLQYLWNLRLNKNRITDAHLEVFRTPGKFVALTRLNIGQNSITDISALQNLTQLRELYFYENGITDISVLSNFTHLGLLNAHKNKIEDITAIQKLSHLKNIWLDNNNIVDINPLVNNTEIENGDMVTLDSNCLNLDIPTPDQDKEDIAALQARGVNVTFLDNPRTTSPPCP